MMGRVGSEELREESGNATLWSQFGGAMSLASLGAEPDGSTKTVLPPTMALIEYSFFSDIGIGMR
jgi:hypothetical protein